MFGYIETGNCVIARPPASMMMIAMTHAKMGRSMKKRAMRAPAYDCGCGATAVAAGTAPASVACTGAPGRIFCRPFDDYPVARCEAILDQPLVADGATDLDRAQLDLAVAAHDHRHGPVPWGRA